ncbi:membrane protein of unknown function [Candidatus Promineifilum breve]|uniref:Acid-resistance membrane protein n=1 Tax=Candidatus Promineifilum breve TaxID=1806508 RepID=A0A161KAK3_9CHLR|nr:DUF308 domain-containing protein [Candidatus Promineifilum breve]CUS03533.2 membrane protein of unknown function [Candidatus Promineifilum breve]
MPDQIKSKVANTAKSALPWQKGIAWWLVLIEGIVLTALGLYMFFAPASANTIIGWIIALTLVVGGAVSLSLSLKAPDKSPARQWTMIHGIVGLAAGGIAILIQLLSGLSLQFALTLLGIGCLAFGGVGLYMLLNKELSALRRISVLSTVLFLLLGGLLLLQALGVGTLATTLQIINMIILIGGIALIIWAFVLKNDAR